MTEETRDKVDLIDLGSIFRSSATLTFIVEIVSVVIMLGALAMHFIMGIFPELGGDIQVLLILGSIAVVLLVFLAALSVFVRFSRRISDAVIGPGIQQVRMDTPRVKSVVYAYALLVTIMGVIALWVFYLIYKNILFPFAESLQSIPLHVFSLALGAFFISLLIQIIVAGVGRTATKVIIEVLDEDDSDFID
jgi:fumarate reductase subunit D